MFARNLVLRARSVPSVPSSTVRFACSGHAVKSPLKEGERVPEVVFKARVRDDKLGGENPFKWKDVKSSDLFAKKRAVVFALPGGRYKLFPP